jgi:signal transduction histidine kinase
LFLTRSALLLIVIIAIVLTVLALSYYKSLMRNKKAKEELMVLNMQIQEQKEKIMTQANELSQANHEVTSINENLEFLVKAKSSKILEQNEKIIEYSFHNSHRVRGPLARILGLIGLVQGGMITQEEIKYVLHEINLASLELDAVIREINDSLYSVIKEVSPDADDTSRS